MRPLVALLAALVLAGCAGPFGFAGNPETLQQIVKIKDANVVCIVANTPYGKGSVLFLNLDKGVIASGGVTIDDACKLAIMLGAKPTP